ncbi:MAG: NAD kinase [Bacteroidales bacterium]|nr:NAD kinase [Bacteroidales bacterium]
MLSDAPHKSLHIALFGNTFQAEKAAVVYQVVKDLCRQVSHISVEQAFYDFLTRQLGLSFPNMSACDACGMEGIDFAVSLGGDGTFLRTASHIGQSATPIIGINTGRLGFLSHITPAEVSRIFAAIAQGHYEIEERTLLSVESQGETLHCTPYALNEVAILKHDNSSTIDIVTTVDGQELARYMADGLIISTPSGSTAYALSAGGPILSPSVNAWVLAPIAPHSLSMRPLVLSDSSTLQLHINSRNDNYLVAIDGRNQSLHASTTLTLRKAPFTLKVVQFPEKNYYANLREKLMWGADQRQ